MPEEKSLVVVQPQQIAPISPTDEALRITKLLFDRRDKCHLLTPMARTEFRSVKPWHRVEDRVTWMDPDPSHGEIYEPSEMPGKMALTKLGLQKLEQLACVNVTSNVEYDPADPHYAKGHAVGTIEDLDGTIRRVTGTRVVDLNDGAPGS